MTKEKKKAQLEFSKYIRLRDCMSSTGSIYHGKCFTCGELFPYNQLQCGHYVSGRNNAVFFEENNAHIQCPECNTGKGGNLEIYREKLIDLYGLEEIELLEVKRYQICKISSDKFNSKFKVYKSLNLELQS